jgi:hypothetical protein
MCDRSKVKIESNNDTVSTQLKGLETREHDKIVSRITGRTHEIQITPVGGGMVPKNPFASQLQQKFLHANPEKVGGEAKLKEWDKSTDFSNLPKKAKKK